MSSSPEDATLTLQDADMIPLYVGAALFALSNMYHMRVSSTFVGTYKDKVYFYLTHLIDLAPMMLYAFKMIEVGMLDVPKSRGFFTIFYMEWIFATTLMLLSLGRLVQLPLATYIRLATVDALMITGGYISMLGTSTAAIYAPFGVSSLCFLYLLYTIWQSYRTHTQSALHRVAPAPTSTKKIHKKAFWGKVYKVLTYVTMTTWLGYPLNHILYKAGVSSFGTCLLVNVALDVVSKLLFVNILIGSHLVYRGDTSVLEPAHA
jgi:bacteriorhodopsin